MMYRFANPDDGYAYSRIELNAIWELIPSLREITESREKTFAFHAHVKILQESGRFLDHVGEIDDERAMELLVHDTLMQEDDPLPAGLHEGCSLDCALDHVPLENGD
jgi:hypothetical protein